MVVLCLGPVCIPLHLLLPFLLTLAHQKGWLLFIKREWVTFRYWKERIAGRPNANAPSNVQQETPEQQCCAGAEVEQNEAGPSSSRAGDGDAARRKKD